MKRYLFDRYLSFLTLDAVKAWPWLGRLALALLVSDDERFPCEQSADLRLGALGRLITQLLYPFEAIARQASSRLAEAAERAQSQTAGTPSRSGA